MTYIQQAIASIGDRGRYQKILMGYLIFCYIELGLIMFGSTFVFMNPQFDCPGLPENPSEEQACPVIESCSIGTPLLTQAIPTRPQSMPTSTATTRQNATSSNQPSTLEPSSVSWA